MLWYDSAFFPVAAEPHVGDEGPRHRSLTDLGVSDSGRREGDRTTPNPEGLVSSGCRTWALVVSTVATTGLVVGPHDKGYIADTNRTFIGAGELAMAFG